MKQIFDASKKFFSGPRLVIMMLIGIAMTLDHIIGSAIGTFSLAMGALAEDRDTPVRDGVLLSFGVAAAKKIYAGSLVVLNSSGYAEPGTTATGKIAVGCADEQIDNSAGDNGDLNVSVRRGVFRFGNSADADLITIAEIGEACFVVDDQTVAKTNGGSTRSIAGKVMDVDADGVWVEVGSTLSLDGDLVAANNLSDVASAATSRSNIGANKVALSVRATNLKGADAVVYGIVSPVAGTIAKIHSVLKGAALATGNATLTGKIGGVAITSGVVTITQAGSAIGDKDDATPSAANVVAAGDEIQFLVGGTNDNAAAFAEISILINT
jgi:hypothetical protein